MAKVTKKITKKKKSKFPFKIEVLHEDANFLVVNKPAGLIVHTDGKTDEPTLVDWILAKYPKLAKVGEPTVLNRGTAKEIILPRPGIVHRLDRETSGVLLLAKNQKAFLHAKEQFQNRQVHKTYYAFVHGGFTHSAGEINRPIGRSTKDFRQWTTQQKTMRGEMRDAVTRYTVLRHNKDYSYIVAKPLTGRTHQIRVHLKAINHPVVADPLYSNNKQNTLGFKRLALHSARIEFKDLKGKTLIVESPQPADFVKALADWDAGLI